MKKLLVVLFLLSSFCGWPQEILTGMQTNPIVRQKYLERQMQGRIHSGSDTIPTGLPFFDDFSYDSVYPTSLLWIDHYAFVNTDIPIYPPNIGAVTLDAIDENGMMYDTAQPGPSPFIADHLTSRYIRLDSVFTPVPRKLRAADSVYLSFFYQPQGRSRNFPLKQDSLILQFLVFPAHDSITPTGSVRVPDKWNRVWSSIGMSLDTFRFYNNDQYFVQVMIPITDTMLFFKKTFRFQFYNWVNFGAPPEISWQSNCDQWNIDNIYLNTGRSMSDTVHPEIRFVDRAPSMLRNYESMPYPQYNAAPDQEIADSVSVILSNRDLAVHNCRYSYKVTNGSGSFTKNYTSPNFNMQPVYTAGPVTLHPTISWFYPVTVADSAVFQMQHIIKDNASGSIFGDTIIRNQNLFNYFAYDDGTPEASYGLTPAWSMLAYRFNLDKPDTLRAVEMYFNQVMNHSTPEYFYLCIWNDDVGVPGDTIFGMLTLPKYADQLNKFVTYHIPPLFVSGTIYIGWIQTTADNLNLGFDAYNDHSDQIFYNTSGKWYPSAYSGSLMIRPVVGKAIPLGTEEKAASVSELRVYPNPCHDGILYLRTRGGSTSSAEGCSITVTNLLGQTLLSSKYSGRLDLTSLGQGIYILYLTDSNGNKTAVRKIIIAP
ncbi:MAG: T9SS type A sorting domain-containing protein [Bacteroidetes bacterium]|nr:T9SS type A sorting domain-containing protein [Bacteroidota bacterium]